MLSSLLELRADGGDGEVLQGRLDRGRRCHAAGARATPAATWSRSAADHPFFSTSDWFIGYDGHAGRRSAVGARPDGEVLVQRPGVGRRAVRAASGQIAASFWRPARTDEPAPGFLQELQDPSAMREGALLVFDEMITGLPLASSGRAARLRRARPICRTFGKAHGEWLRVVRARRAAGDHAAWRLRPRPRARLPAVHDARRGDSCHGSRNRHDAMSIATEPVVEHLHRQGRRLREGVTQVVERSGLLGTSTCVGATAACLFATCDRRPAAEPAVAHAVHAGADPARCAGAVLRRELFTPRRRHRSNHRSRPWRACGVREGPFGWCRGSPGRALGEAGVPLACVAGHPT